MSMLNDALTALKTKINLQHTDLAVGASSLDTVAVSVGILADIKTSTCISECVTAFTSVPQYVVPELPVPTGTITFSTPSKGYTAITQPFSYSGTDATYYTATVNGVSIGAVTSPISLTGLDPDTNYTIAVTPQTIFGSGTEASTTVHTYALTSLIINGVGAKPIGVITFGSVTKDTSSISQPFTYSGVGQLGFFAKINNGSAYIVTSPIELISLTDATIYNIKVAAYNNGGIGTWYETNVQTDALPDTPLGTITFGTPTIGETTISQPFTYSDVDATHFIGFLDGVSLGTVVSPIELTGLTPDTPYLISVVPVNLVGSGNTFSITDTTLESAYELALYTLTLEALYFHDTDISLIPPSHTGGSPYPLRSGNMEFDVYLNTVFVGRFNLTNDGSTADDYNYPSELTGGTWVGSPYSRYSKIVLTLEQVADIAANQENGSSDLIGFAIYPTTAVAFTNLQIRYSVAVNGVGEPQALYFTHSLADNRRLNTLGTEYVGRWIGIKQA